MIDLDSRQDLLDGHRNHLNRSLARVLSLLGAGTEVRSSGCHVESAEGDVYLNCGGYGVFLLGHCHPAVVAAVSAQLRDHPLATRSLLEPRVIAAARALTTVAPPGLDYVYFTNSGAEAVELGLKVARANGRRRVIAMENGFHGKTAGALSVTGRPAYRSPFEPLLQGVDFVPYNDAAALETALKSALSRGEQAALLVEPVQGEGGVRVPAAGFLRCARELCDRHGAMLVADEVQTGLGRLGAWWGCAAEGITPDILLAGKALGGGVLPVGAMLTSSRWYEPFNRDPLLHSSTFAGNPLAAMAVTATLAVIEGEGLVERARDLGERLLARIREIVEYRCPDAVVEVRGRGLLIGVEFAKASTAADLMTELLRRKVLTSFPLNTHTVLRFTPPAVLTERDVDWLLGAFDEAADTVGRRRVGLIRRS